VVACGKYIHMKKPIEKKTVVLRTRVDEPTHEKLRGRSETLDRSVCWIIGEAIRVYLEGGKK